jgi:hypothetical protein
MNIPTDPDGQVLNIDFYPRRRVNCVGPARLLLNVEDATKLAQFLGEAVESRPPVANIEHGVLVCECGHRGTPRLEESGYQVSHALVEIVGDTIIASGWDGSSRAVSEEGDAYWLMCMGAGSCIHYRRNSISTGGKVLRIVVWLESYHIPQLLAGFYGEGALPGTSPRFFAGDRQLGGPSWSEEAVEYFERRGEFNG